jgi:predicted small secreted protein
MEEPMSRKDAGRFALVLLFGAMLAACGSTWEGMKQDTGENLEALGGATESAGEDIQEESTGAQPTP